MQIKIFKAGTMKDAMAAMKAELGSDAVILHSKKYREGGLLGLGSREVVEITAAIEESSLPKKDVEARPAQIKGSAFSAALAKYKTSGTAQGVAQAEKNLEPPPPKVTAPPKKNPAPVRPPAPSFAEVLDDAEKNPPAEKIPQMRNAPDKPAPKIEKPVFEKISKAAPPPIEEVEEVQPPPVEEVEEVPPPPVEEIEEVQPSPVEEVEEVQSPPVEEVEEVQPPPVEEVEEVQPPPVEEVEEVQPPPVEEVEEVQPPPVEEVEEVQPPPVEKAPKVKPARPQKSSQVRNAPDKEEIPPAAEKIPSAEEKIPATEKIPVEEIPQEEQPQPSEQVPPAQQPPPQSQYGAEMTPEQMTQAQAMMFAQFNQMQMMQMMQQAIYQTQATQVQIQEMQAQAQMQAQSIPQAREIQNPREPVRAENFSRQEEEEIDESSAEQIKIKKLEKEISQMKALLAEVLGRGKKKSGLSLHEALRRQEVEESILSEMATTSVAGETLVDSQSMSARNTLTNYLNEHLKFSEGIRLNRHGARIAALLGTTGVGKTTTLAKIAAKFVLEQGINAALITADTYRISAVDQLKTYSDILGLPLEIVYNPTELGEAIDRHKDKDLILIDTAGRSQQNEYQMRELGDFLKVNPRIEKHLVISATTKLTDAREIMKKFAAVSPEKIVLTKIDETGSLGMIINLLKDVKISLSYITTGQSVPDDIESASAEILADLLLKKITV